MADPRSLRALLLLVAATLALAGAGCIENDGVTPPAEELNFPIALGLSQPPGAGEPPGYLYVVNSNFDLRYNAGSVQAVDLSCALDRLRACAGAEECEAVADEPGCDLVTSEVLIGSHASGVALAPDGRRLFLPVRSEGNLTYLEVNSPSTLTCGGTGTPPRCDAQHRRGDEVGDVQLPSDPVGVYAGSLSDLNSRLSGSFVLLAHRGGAASLFFDERESGREVPRLVGALTGLAQELIDVAFDGRTAWIPSAVEPEIARVGVAVDEGSEGLSGTLLYDAGSVAVVGVDTGAATTGDTRAVEFDPRDDNIAYVLSRRPEAVLVADVGSGRPGLLNVTDVIEVGEGPSRLQVAEVRGTLLGFASCFDSRDLYILDLDRRRLLGVVREMSGPFELVVDTHPEREAVYVADFRASVIRVVPLQSLLSCLDGTVDPTMECSPAVLGTIGHPRPIVVLR